VVCRRSWNELALVERAPDLGDLDAPLQFGMAGEEHRGEDLGLLDHDAPARADHATELTQSLLGLDDVMEHVAAPDPVHAVIGKRDGGAVAGLELEPPALDPASHERPGRLDLLQLGLDAEHVTARPDRLGQPERVQPDAAAHVEPAGAGGQAEIANDLARFRLLEVVHPLERGVRAVDGGHGEGDPTRGAGPGC